MTEDRRQKLELPFRGKILRSTSNRFREGMQIDVVRVGTAPGHQQIRFTHSEEAPPKVLEPVEQQTLEALVVPDENLPMTLVTFRHPTDPKRLVTVVLEKDPRGEIDGVWVAEEDGGGDDEPPRHC